MFLKILKFGVITIMVVVAISFLIAGEFVSAFLFLFAGVVFSSLGKYLIRVKSKRQERVYRVAIGVVLCLVGVINAAIGDETVTKKSPDDQRNRSKRDSIATILAEKKITICDVASDLETIEINAIKKADKKYPEFDFPQHGDYTQKIIDKEQLMYRQRHQIDSILFDEMYVYVMECLEQERKQRVVEAQKEEKHKNELLDMFEGDCYTKVHLTIKDRIKEKMVDPDSYKEIRYGYKLEANGTILVEFEYQGANVYGGVAREITYFRFDPNTCELIP